MSMKYYIVDDSIAIIKNLENLIKARDMGTVCGYSTNPETALREILQDKPDIVIVDYLMDHMDGVALVELLSAEMPEMYFVMLSKVSDKKMIQKAYSAGVEFFINKPINAIEVEKVLRNVAEKANMKGVLSQLKTIVGNVEADRSGTAAQQQEGSIRDIDVLLGKLGMLGEKGTQDIRRTYAYMIEHRTEYSKEVLEAVAAMSNETVKNLEQRIRRAMKKGLSNAACVAMDDMYSDVLELYANYVFDFSAIRDEINYQKGKSANGGRLNISGFMEGLCVYSKE